MRASAQAARRALVPARKEYETCSSLFRPNDPSFPDFADNEPAQRFARRRRFLSAYPLRCPYIIRILYRTRQTMTGKDHIEGAGGWLLAYLVGSIPVLLFYSMGLSGWFFEYPAILMGAIFLALAAPLWLLLRKHPSAPRWNVAALWAGSVLMTLRMAYGALFDGILEGWPRPHSGALLGELAIFPGIILFSLAWAIVWTQYFRRSARIRNTFS